MTTLDLTGVPCPMNWVRTRLALEELKAGERLEVVLDSGEPLESVPRSASEARRIASHAMAASLRRYTWIPWGWWIFARSATVSVPLPSHPSSPTSWLLAS